MDIELVKIVSIFSNEKDYIFKTFQVKIFKTIDYNEVNKLLFKAEEFWINKDFGPSSKEIITYLRLN